MLTLSSMLFVVQVTSHHILLVSNGEMQHWLMLLHGSGFSFTRQEIEDQVPGNQFWSVHGEMQHWLMLLPGSGLSLPRQNIEIMLTLSSILKWFRSHLTIYLHIALGQYMVRCSTG